MPKHRKPSRHHTAAVKGAVCAGASVTAATVVLTPAAAQAATVAVTHATAETRAAQPVWWHAAHLAHLAHLADGAYRPRHAAPAAYQAAAYTGSSAFQQCVIARESGGNPDVMNATGHYGLYQFSYQTWVAYGGSPSAFGHATVAEQNQVFANAMATPGGAGNWAPYDGC